MKLNHTHTNDNFTIKLLQHLNNIQIENPNNHTYTYTYTHIKLLDLCLSDDDTRANILYNSYKKDNIIILEDIDYIISGNYKTYQTLYSMLKYNHQMKSKIICMVSNKYDHNKISASMFTSVLLR